VSDFDEFFDQQKHSLLAQAYVLTGRSEEAEDLVQEAFVRCWRNWDRVGEMERPAAWARLVLHNLAIGRWRRERHRATRQLKASDRPTPPPDVGHLDIAKALRRLDERQRRAVVLHDVVGLSVAETALDMRAPEGSIRGWLSRGRQSLAAILTEMPEVGKETTIT
jgi:RNA polymerase sigma-70 factor (ECF subfamily)